MVNYHQVPPFGRIFLDASWPSIMAQIQGIGLDTEIPTELGSNPLQKPCKMNMEHNNGGLEDDFPFQLGAFCVPC